MEKQHESKRNRLVLVMYPLQGHMNPILDLASVLHSRGFSITVAHTTLNPPDPASFPDFTFLPISDGISTWDISPSNLVNLAYTINRNCAAPFKGCLSQIIHQEEQHGRVVCVIYDFLMHFAETAANEFNLPSIIFRTSNAAALLAFCTMAELSAQGQDFIARDSPSDDLVPGLFPLRFKDLPISSMGSLEKFSQLLAVVCSSRSSSAIIFNTTDCLENFPLTQLRRHYQIPFFHLGPLHRMAPKKPTNLVKDKNNCIKWLEKQARNSVIYVSLGSIATMDEKDLTEMAWGLALSEQPFLWVIRTCESEKKQLPEGFHELVGERGCVVEWAHQIEVLSHPAVGAFFTHCGWNSTLESICEGVPMICKPYFADQTVNARYLTHEWGLGIELGNVIQRTEIEKAVRRILVENEGVEMRQKAISLREQIKKCIKEGGCANNSLNEFVQFLSSFSEL
ncbi:OLC1v1006111C1 [Oldenlandia corymbosa var. corymbosa]|uniref:Glycosyltransferase n=1 Tax=Oldenlandia corymbosa var. corymbosa TaxID=529605 RepID=A0AAV1DJL7_OLDCO|nr:OLC1v1006111C1 [Oldenlandia corymbosa var. corymbosa]